MFANLSEVFDAISDCEYVVLRNYEDFDNMDFLKSHPDIDLLCRNREAVITALSLKTRRKKEDFIHYYVVVDNVKVAVDLRCVGDGYLDEPWEDNILQSRVPFQNYYVMDDVNYFYSLLYHVTVQKNTVADDYKERLKKMGEGIGVHFRIEEKERLLDGYMEENFYHYSYPEYDGTIFHIKNVRKDLVEKNAVKKLKRGVYRTARGCVKLFKK